MNNILLPPLVLHCLSLTVFCILIAVPLSYCDDKLYKACSHPYPFSCGSGIELNLSYPFWGNPVWGKDRPRQCGREEFKLTCEDHSHPILDSLLQMFRVLGINTTEQTVTILSRELRMPWDISCPDRSNVGVHFNQFLYNYSSNVRNLSLFYNCIDGTQLHPNNYTCYERGSDQERKSFYTIDDGSEYFPNHTRCSNIAKVPIQLIDDLVKHEPRKNLEWLGPILYEGLEVKYEAENGLCSACQHSSGICGSHESKPGEFMCLCRDKPSPQTCPGADLPLLFNHPKHGQEERITGLWPATESMESPPGSNPWKIHIGEDERFMDPLQRTQPLLTYPMGRVRRVRYGDGKVLDTHATRRESRPPLLWCVR